MSISSRRYFLGAGFGAPLVEAGRRTRPARPNIVFVLTDDQRFDALGIAGHPFFKSPNMDRIGREGAMLRNCFVTTPLCSPSRASFLTGQYAHT
jgi:N-acetylglucosamine-6-sulfatase